MSPGNSGSTSRAVVPSSSGTVARAGAAAGTPGVSLARQVVLDEDEYTAALSHIIKRDFFPNLPRLAATNAYLSALENQDSSALATSLRALSSLNPSGADGSTPRRSRKQEREMGNTHTPYVSRTPFGGGVDMMLETPMSASGLRVESDEEDEGGEEGGRRKRRRVDKSKGVDDFQHLYTSEDNASFLEILTEDNSRRREKHAWAFQAEQAANTNRLRLEQDRRRLLIEHGGYVDQGDGVLRIMPGSREDVEERGAGGGGGGWRWGRGEGFDD